MKRIILSIFLLRCILVQTAEVDDHNVLHHTGCYKTFSDMYDAFMKDFSESDEVQDEEYGLGYGRLVPQSFLAAQLWVSHLSGQAAYIKDECGKQKRVSIPDLVIGQDLHIKDIFLASKLAEQGKLVLPGQNPGFGSTPQEQYIACTADTSLQFSGDMSETFAELSLFYTWRGYNCLKLAAGVYIPVRHQKRRLHLDCAAGFLVCGQPVNFIGENNVTQFFNDFIDFNDYLFRGIFAQKCIKCMPFQEKTGIGDVSVAVIVDAAEYNCNFQVARFGLMGILPTGCIRSGNILWEIELGTGAFRFKPFIDIHTWTGYRYFNPRLYLDVIYSAPFVGMRRVPQRKNERYQLLMPVRYEPYTVLPFDDFDVTKREVSDVASPTKIHYGAQVDILVGNLFFNIMQSSFSAGLFYEGRYKSADRYEVRCAQTQFNTRLLKKITSEVTHAIRWNMQWSFDERSVFEFGSSNVLGGKNTLIINQLYASLILYY